MSAEHNDAVDLRAILREVFVRPDDMIPLIFPGDACERSLFFKSSVGRFGNVLNLEVRVKCLDLSDIDSFKNKIQQCRQKIEYSASPLASWEFAIDLDCVESMDQFFLTALISEIMELRTDKIDAFACNVHPESSVYRLMKRYGLLDGFTLSGAVGAPPREPRPMSEPS